MVFQVWESQHLTASILLVFHSASLLRLYDVSDIMSILDNVPNAQTATVVLNDTNLFINMCYNPPKQRSLCVSAQCKKVACSLCGFCTSSLMSQVFLLVNLSEVWRYSKHATSIGTWIDWIRGCEKQNMRFSMRERTRTHPESRISLSKAQESQHTVLTSNDDLLQTLLKIWTYQYY
jgi:hypothetical protein